MPKRVGAVVRPTSRLPASFVTTLKRNPDFLSSPWTAPEHIKKTMKLRYGQMGMPGVGGYNPATGKIHIERNTAASMGTVGSSVSRVPSSAKADRGITAAHEASERKYSRREGIERPGFFSHAHPGVLLEEHNLLSRLEGKGPRQAGAMTRRVRQLTGEHAALKDVLVEKFKDPRAASFLRPGVKVPRAMRNRLIGLMR